MKGRVKWVQDVMFVAESGSGHAVVIDGAPEGGGRNMGFRPMELVLLGTGGCTAYDVVTILRKQRQDIVDVVAEMSAERAPTDPKVFTKVHIHFVVKGRNVNETHVKRAIELTSDKYCSASIMLKQSGTAMTHDYEIIEI